jgi:lipopolysaccharide export system permease protein
MKVYIKFIIKFFLKSIFFVSIIMLSLAIIINTLTEFEFFSGIEVKTLFPFYLSLLNSPTLIFEMFPFIFLISTQLFFINLLNNNEIEIFKYSGLKNSSIIKIVSIVSFFLGLFIIVVFYNFSSNLKNFYLEIKSKYTKDGKYLAVITNNGLWIKDVINGKTNIINASKIDQNILIDTFITEFNNDYEVIRNIKSERIDIKNYEWRVFNAKVYENQTSTEYEILTYKSNFNYDRIQSLFSNLSSLSLKELFVLKKNYELLNYSITEVSVQINKIISYPIYLTLMTIFSAIIMFKTKKLKSTSLKMALGLFFSVIVYYTFNFFNVMGNTEKFSILVSVWFPILSLTIINSIMIYRINEK